MSTIRLELGPALVREWQPEDAEGLARQADDRRVWINMRDAFPHPYGIEDALHFISLAIGKSPVTYFAIEASGRVAGGIGYTLHTGHVVDQWIYAILRDEWEATTQLPGA